jgi:hypothetical protein
MARETLGMPGVMGCTMRGSHIQKSGSIENDGTQKQCGYQLSQHAGADRGYAILNYLGRCQITHFASLLVDSLHD